MINLNDTENQNETDSLNIQPNKLDLANLYPNPISYTSVPVDLPSSDTYHEYFNGQTMQPAASRPELKPGFFETVKLGAAHNDLNNINNHIDAEDRLSNPLDDYVPPGWKVSDEDIADIDPRYSGYMLASTGPKDFKRRLFNAYEMEEKEKYYDNGTMLGHLTGELLGGAMSPTTYLPMLGEIRNASLSVRLLQDLTRVLPGVAASAATHEAITETTKVTGNLDDFVTDTFRDIIVGTAFMGTAMGLGHGFTGGKIWNARKAVNVIGKDIDLEPVIAKDGSMIGLKATSQSAGAAEVEKAQVFADSSFAQNGLFAVPIIGNWIGKGAGKVNPIIRMLNSPSMIMRGYIDRFASHGLVTEGIKKGIAAPDKFENKMAALNGSNTQFMWWLKGLHLERNGLDSSKRVRSAFSEASKKWKEDGSYTSPQEFMNEIQGVITNEVPSVHATVNEAAAAMRERMDKDYLEFRKAYNLPEDWLDPKTAKGYLSRVYDLEHMRVNKAKWMQVVTKSLRESDAVIESRMQPIREAQERIKEHKANHEALLRGINKTDQEVKRSVDELKSLKMAKKGLEEKLQNELRTNPELRLHVEDTRKLSANESKQLKALTKKVDIAVKEIKAQKAFIADMKTKIAKRKESALKSKTTKTGKKNLRKSDTGELALAPEEAKLHLLEQEHDQELENIQQKIHNGEVHQSLYYKEEGSSRYTLRDPKDRLKMRDVYESDFHRERAAESAYLKIMNQTAEDTISQVMGGLMGHESMKPLMERSLLVPDQVMYDAQFLDKNLGVNLANYRNVLGRRTFIKNIFKDVTLEGGIAPIAELLSKEHQADLARLNAKLDKLRNAENKNEKDIKKAEKAIRQRDRQFESDKEDMQLTYDKAMGKTRGSQKQRDYSRVVRNFGAATKLGSVPLTMASDLFAITMKHGLWPFIKNGLLPTLKNISRQLQNGKGDKYIKYAPHAHMGLNHVLSAYSDRNWAGSAQPYTPLTGKLVNGTEKLAHISSNIAGTNQAENFFQEITASTVQSDIMQFLKEFKEGTISKRDKEKLLLWGIQPEKWADRFHESWKKAGSDGNGLGGFESRFWEWTDTVAAEKMSESVMIATKDTIIRRGMFDAPFAMDNPFIGTMFMFKGWVLASLTRYLTPLMQRPDSQKLIGTMLMLMAGSMVTPLRRISKGEDPIQEDDNMFWNALVDGGVFSSVTDSLETINVLMGGNLLKDIKNDRYRDRTMSGLLAGPAGGMAEDVMHILKMMSSGHLNQTDVNRIARLIPFTQSWQFRGLSNKMVESLGLPKTYNEATNR